MVQVPGRWSFPSLLRGLRDSLHLCWVDSVCVCAQSLQMCLTLCDHMDCSPPGSSVRGILQARILEWVCHFLLQEIFPTPGIEPRSPALASGFVTTEPPGKHTFHRHFSCTDVQMLCLHFLKKKKDFLKNKYSGGVTFFS